MSNSFVGLLDGDGWDEIHHVIELVLLGNMPVRCYGVEGKLWEREGCMDDFWRVHFFSTLKHILTEFSN